MLWSQKGKMVESSQVWRKHKATGDGRPTAQALPENFQEAPCNLLESGAHLPSEGHSSSEKPPMRPPSGGQHCSGMPQAPFTVRETQSVATADTSWPHPTR